MSPLCDILTAAVLDSIENQIAVIDRNGIIFYVNQAWVDFGRSNGMGDDHEWVGTSYLNACRSAAKGGDVDGAAVFSRIRSVLDGRMASFNYEYPCHSPSEQRWFMMRVVPVRGVKDLFVVSHQVITERELAEERVEHQNHELERLASTDKLTQLLNRLKLDEILSGELERANRYQSPLSLAMVDVDLFKVVNDSLGHRVGDSVLREVAGLMHDNVRKSDSVGRWGGEEFLILMPGSALAPAGLLAEKLRKKTAKHVFPGAGSITCSYGVAQYRLGESVTDFVDRADAALYRAKQNGRNRVELSYEPSLQLSESRLAG